MSAGIAFVQRYRNGPGKAEDALQLKACCGMKASTKQAPPPVIFCRLLLVVVTVVQNIIFLALGCFYSLLMW